jgi:N-acetylmuramoyl-L-alanine amidase
MKFIIDAGHGGFLFNGLITPGKRATLNGVTLYEGILNRVIAQQLQWRLTIRNIPNYYLTPGVNDKALYLRVDEVNDIVSGKYNDHLLISIHHNASDNPDAKGFEVFTSVGETISDSYANKLCRLYENNTEINHRPLRKGTDQLNKERNFQIITKTICPAVLTEWSFMTNPFEFDYMVYGNGIRDEVNLLTEWCEWIYNHSNS